MTSLSADPEHLEAKNNLSICQIRLDQKDLAINGFREVAENLYEGQFNLAVQLIEKGEFQEMFPVVQAVVKRGRELGHVESELLDKWLQKFAK